MQRTTNCLVPLLAAIALLTACQAGWADDAAEAAVVIDGKRNPGNTYREFIWTIKNNGTEAITSFIAPAKLGGGLIEPPRGWTGVAGFQSIGGSAEQYGVTFEASGTLAAIRPGAEKVFLVRVHADVRWQPREHTVAIQLADGSELLIDGVMCPDHESTFKHNFPLIGLGTIFVIFLIAQLFRKRKPQDQSDAES